ncbi:MAG TPA: efflux RND transporter periplasmic adaptor subunit, partial [Phycisphaerae bacterium]
MTRKLVILTAILLVLGGIFALNRIGTRHSIDALLHVAPTDPLSVTVARPQRQTITRVVQAPGQVEAVLEVEISSEIPAKIIAMPVVEGQAVRAGDVLCELNGDEYRAGVASGEAAVAKLGAAIQQAEADLEKCDRDMLRMRDLSEHDATNSIEVADCRTAFVKAKASVEIHNQELAEARAQLQRARENLAKTHIKSPIDGVISQLHAKQGEVVVTGTMNNPGTVVMVITDLSQMQVRARVDETDVPLVQPDQLVRIYLPSDPVKAIPGRVLRVATSGTKPPGRDVVTFETLVLVESDSAAVKPAMTANVEIEVARKESTLTVPVQAIVYRRRKDLPDELVRTFEQREDDSDAE